MYNTDRLPEGTLPVVYAASIGHSGWFSHDLGESWQRAHTNWGGIYNESRCWCFAIHPDRPGELLAGTDQGIYRWDPRVQRWNYVPSPMDGLHILKLTQCPANSDLIIAGTRPAELFRSEDGGLTWEWTPIANKTEVPYINTPRVTSLQFDPEVAGKVWMTIEIDGVWRSDDAGKSWVRLGTDLPDQDTHNVVILRQDGKRVVLCTTEIGLFRSEDEGETFAKVDTGDIPYHYFRHMLHRPDNTGVLFLSVGDRPSGDDAMLLRSRDYGANWEVVDLPGNQNSTIWSISAHPADPMLLFCHSIMGEIYRSLDGGETWEKMEKFLGELREVVWAPVPEQFLSDRPKAWVTADEFAAESSA
ncbi:MAG: hypothetical protein D6763_11825 [Alphaproteobacteria bacterium]|nr:MAG: hypothetical protein D6763_11825 [Alphaproteobacteria bacterium]